MKKCTHKLVKHSVVGIGSGRVKDIWQCKCGCYFIPQNICHECEVYEDGKCYHKKGACSTQKGIYQNFIEKIKECNVCNGEGFIDRDLEDGDMGIKCSFCEGTGVKR